MLPIRTESSELLNEFSFGEIQRACYLPDFIVGNDHITRPAATVSASLAKVSG